MSGLDYLRPETVAQAYDWLEEHGEEAKIIAGGQSLMVILGQKLLSPAFLIDIKGLKELDYIKYSARDGLRIGAMTTHRSLELSPVIRQKYPALADAERRLASVQVRNWGTIGGNLCHADPKTDLAACLIALKGKARVKSSSGERDIAFADFFLDYYETALKPGEILTEIRIPAARPGSGAAYKKFSIRWADAPLIGVCAAVALDAEKRTAREVRIVLAGAGATPFRAIRAEAALRGQELSDSLVDRAAQIASEDCSPVSDVEASELYKREIAKVLVAEIVKEAWERARKT